MRDDDDVVVAARRVLILEAAPPRGDDTERAEEVWRDRGAGQSDGIAAIVDGILTWTVARDFGECVKAVLEGQEFSRGSAADEHQLLRPRIRQRAKHERVDHGEDRGVRANADAQRKYRGDREPRCAAERPPP